MVGWLWVIAGFVLPALDLADPSVFPGVILIFVARALRTQLARHAPPEEVEEEPDEPARVLNTERARPVPTPEPAKTPAPEPPKPAQPTTRQPAPKTIADVSKPEDRDDVIERIAMAGRAASEPTSPVGSPGVVKTPAKDEERQAPMSSAEMIAQAKKRWDKKS